MKPGTHHPQKPAEPSFSFTENRENTGLYPDALSRCNTLLWAFKQPGREKYKLLFHNGSFKKKVLKYCTPKPSSPQGSKYPIIIYSPKS